MSKKLLNIKRALISVSNKSNILKLANVLSQYNIQLLASEGTAKILLNSGIPVTKISQYTNSPEIMNGRIKTLHTKIYSEILARPKIDDDIIQEYSIKPINMVIANFYPYTPIIKKNNIQNNYNKHKNITDNIDIGGPSIVRSAAKNYENVVVVVNSNDYDDIIHELNDNTGKISIQTRLKLATKAFQYVAAYDTLIANNFTKQLKKNNFKNNKKINTIHLPDYISFMDVNYLKKENMRYGENPHQFAAFYVQTQNIPQGCIAQTQQLQGKKLSYNNILDIDTALECVKMFHKPTCVIVKHGTPCGVATDDTILTAYKKAYQSDPISSFGGIIAFNKILDKNTAHTIIKQQFSEVIIAPFIEDDAIKIFKNKQNIRILTCGPLQSTQKKSIKKITSNLDFKRVNGGLLIQEQDTGVINISNIEIVTTRQPTHQEIIDALFSWKVVKFSKSNAIVYSYKQQTIGISSGQTSRIDAAKIASLKAKYQGFNLKGSVMASDAFLPFPDTIDIAANNGISCIIQPGGGIHDQQIITNANKHNISMIFTHVRQFRH